MTQIKFRADINAVEFPLLYEWASRTVIQNPADQGQPPITTPQILYCQDVLPTQQGYKSVSYKDLIAAASPANITFSNIFNVADAAQNKALIGVTLDSHIYMLTAASPNWVDVTPGGWAGGDAVTVGNANGSWYLYLANKGCYLINVTGVVLTLTALTSITAANIVGMSSSINYLLLYDATTVYWSSTINPLDFTPSTITGAGSSVPFDELGKIITIKQLNNGFCVYTTSNAVLASYSNNAVFPWVFRNANNVAGIVSYKQVNQAAGLGFHIALTSAGITQITPQGGDVITPEITDFLAAKDIESFDQVNNLILDTDIDRTAPLNSAIAIIGARYIVVSYGITGYTDAIVYDLALKRYGKLHVNHVCCFEIKTYVEGVISPYNDPAEIGQTYAAASPQTYNSTAITLNNPPDVGRIFGFLQADGTVKLAYLNNLSSTDNAILVLGKYQATRSNLLELEEIDIELVPVENTGLQILVASSINGKDLLPAQSATLIERGIDINRYAIRAVGKNHQIIFKGSFDLTMCEITATLGSRR